MSVSAMCIAYTSSVCGFGSVMTARPHTRRTMSRVMDVRCVSQESLATAHIKANGQRGTGKWSPFEGRSCSLWLAKMMAWHAVQRLDKAKATSCLSGQRARNILIRMRHSLHTGGV
eukprot:scaffold2644_cov33-Tisochrysis_lutea.AAC.3